MALNINNRRILTQNMYKAEAVLREFKTEYPYLNSNIKYNAKISEHCDKEKFAHILPILRGNSMMSGFKILEMRRMYEESKNKIYFLSKAVKATKTAGCQECSILMHNKLSERGIPAQNVRFAIEQKNGFDTDRNHAFTVIGLSEGAKLEEPKTWGKNAVIIDGWANIVKRATDGIEYFKDMFKYNPEKEVCKFSEHRNI